MATKEEVLAAVRLIKEHCKEHDSEYCRHECPFCDNCGNYFVGVPGDWDDPEECGADDACYIVEHEVPASDVAEVVRCRDCKWCHSGYCERFDDLIPFGLHQFEWENWFCADGKRRSDNG